MGRVEETDQTATNGRGGLLGDHTCLVNDARLGGRAGSLRTIDGQMHGTWEALRSIPYRAPILSFEVPLEYADHMSPLPKGGSIISSYCTQTIGQ